MVISLSTQCCPADPIQPGSAGAEGGHRHLDSNFQYAGAVNLVVAPLLTRPVAWDGSAAGRATQQPPSEKPKGRSGVSPSRRHKPGKGSFGRRTGLFPSLFL